MFMVLVVQVIKKSFVCILTTSLGCQNVRLVVNDVWKDCSPKRPISVEWDLLTHSSRVCVGRRESAAVRLAY